MSGRYYNVQLADDDDTGSCSSVLGETDDRVSSFEEAELCTDAMPSAHMGAAIERYYATRNVFKKKEGSVPNRLEIMGHVSLQLYVRTNKKYSATKLRDKFSNLLTRFKVRVC